MALVRKTEWSNTETGESIAEFETSDGSPLPPECARFATQAKIPIRHPQTKRVVTHYEGRLVIEAESIEEAFARLPELIEEKRLEGQRKLSGELLRVSASDRAKLIRESNGLRMSE